LDMHTFLLDSLEELIIKNTENLRKLYLYTKEIRKIYNI